MPRRRAAARTALSNSSEILRFTDFRLGLYSNGNGARFSALMYSAKSFSRSSSASLSVLSAGNLLLIFAELPLMHEASAYRPQPSARRASPGRENDERIAPILSAADR